MRYATPLLTILLCLLISGCGTRHAEQVPCPPAVIAASRCPAPAPPALPALRKGILLDDPANVAALKERDRRMRRYIQGLRAALNCYDRQVAE